MTSTFRTKTPQDALSVRTTTALRIVVGISLLAACVMALAEAEDVGAPLAAPTELSTEQLERAFWACEHAARTRGVDGAEGMACSQATEDLKAQKFNGSFEAMLDWWGVEKDGALRAIDPAADTLARSEDFPQP